jgi:hypothetical protein
MLLEHDAEYVVGGGLKCLFLLLARRIRIWIGRVGGGLHMIC